MATLHWLTGTSGLWSTATGWTGATAPTATDDVLIDAAALGAGGYSVSVDGADTANSLGVIAGVTVKILTGDALTLTAGTGSGSNAGTITIGDGTTLSAGGTFDNAGLVTVQSTGNATFFKVDAATLTLAGSGTLKLADAGSQSQISAAGTGDILVNFGNTISGAGDIGAGGLVIHNGSSGVIDATGGDRLTLDSTGSVVNLGVLEATSGGGLQITTGASIDNTGTILANGANVYLDGTVDGGTLSAPAGQFVVESGITGTVSDAAITAGSTVAVDTTASLNVSGAMHNAGTIVIGAAPAAGTMFVSGSTFQVVADASPDTFTESAPLTTGTTTLDNGTVDLAVAIVPDGTSEWLTFTYTTAGNTPLGVQGVNWSVNEVGLDAAEPLVFNAAYVQFYKGTAVLAPTSSIFSGYSMGTNPVPGQTGTGLGGSGYNDDINSAPSPLGSLGTYIDPWNHLDGTGIDSTVVTGYEEALEFAPQVAATDPSSALLVNGDTTLTGGGTIQLTDAGATSFGTGSQISSQIEGHQFVNVDNTITGAGVVGAGLLFDNQAAGVINANAADTLLLNSSGGSLSNEGLIESTGAGGLEFSEGSVTNTGTILVNGGNVTLDSASITGGTLAGSNGSFQIGAGNFTTLSDVTVAKDTKLSVASSANLTLTGGGTDNGEIDVTGDDATVSIDSSVVTPGAIFVSGSNDTVVLGSTEEFSATPSLLPSAADLVATTPSADAGVSDTSSLGGASLAWFEAPFHALLAAATHAL